MGARTIVTTRDDAKGAATLDAIKERTPDAEVEAVRLDLSRLSDVRRAANDILQRCDRIDVLVNNAGLILGTRSVTEDGYEATFQVNHLGPFLLTKLLLDRIKASAPARVVNVASTAHRSGRLDFDDLQSERSYRSMRVYGMTKLCNILFTLELARRLEGTGVTANSLHPGTVRTGFGKDGDTQGFFAIGVRIGGIFFKSPAQGARTSIHLASSSEVEGKTGEYWVNRKISRPSAAARDDGAARRLWDISDQLVG
jgi:NAD(P)-dependent dehydrogenase (short-subunit alcohol dehydrogenase family)